MNNKFNVGDIIQSTYSDPHDNDIYFLVIEATHISNDNQLYKFKNIAYDLELTYSFNDITYKNYEIVSKS
jgi:hypothetical protein